MIIISWCIFVYFYIEKVGTHGVYMLFLVCAQILQAIQRETHTRKFSASAIGGVILGWLCGSCMLAHTQYIIYLNIHKSSKVFILRAKTKTRKPPSHQDDFGHDGDGDAPRRRFNASTSCVFRYCFLGWLVLFLWKWHVFSQRVVCRVHSLSLCLRFSN